MIGYHQGYQDSGITGPTGLGGLKDVLEKDAPGEATAPQDNGKEMDEVEAPKGKNFESTFTLYNILVRDISNLVGFPKCWQNFLHTSHQHHAFQYIILTSKRYYLMFSFLWLKTTLVKKATNRTPFFA